MNTDDSLYSNLYIDESGYSYLGQPYYQFFLITAFVISPSQRVLANLLMEEWRNKYLLDNKKCFHAFDFFESKTKNYTQKKARIPRVYQKAVDDLIEILSHIHFSANVYYVNFKKLRTTLSIANPPSDSLDEANYKKAKNQYSNELKKSFGDKVQLPLTITFKKALEFHMSEMDKASKIDKFKREPKGYINVESRNESDSFLIKVFHKYGQNIYRKIGDDVVGLNLHTKGSLDSGIEIADFISYTSFQTLRSKYRLKHELSAITKSHLSIIINARKKLRKFGINIIDVSDEAT